jgi:BRCA1-associated ATM activator 1
MQHNICPTVEIIAKNDSEPYVRASAFKVLGAMVKIRLFWDNVLHEMDVKVSKFNFKLNNIEIAKLFQKYALEVLGNESEGVVRREAVTCIAQVYKHREIPEHSLDTVFSVLAHCAVSIGK